MIHLHTEKLEIMQQFLLYHVLNKIMVKPSSDNVNPNREPREILKFFQAHAFPTPPATVDSSVAGVKIR